jgi:hypothetical protein
MSLLITGTGPTVLRTFTFPDANAVILTDHDVVTPAQGGTGIASYAIGDLLYASGASALSKLAAVATGRVLVSSGVATAPAWSASPTLTSLTATSLITQGSALGFAATSTDGIVLQNTTPATAGVPAQYSPRVRWSGTAYNSVSGLSETSSWWAEVITAGAAGTTAASLAFKALVNGVTTQPFFMSSVGSLTLLSQLSAPILAVNNNGFIIAPANGQFVVENNTAAAGVGLDVSTDSLVKIRTRAHTGYATVDALGYSVSGVAGASKVAGPVTSITVVNGIVTAIS